MKVLQPSPVHKGDQLLSARLPILLVDDAIEIREMLGMYLANEGYAIFEADNGERAFDYLKAGLQPCVIFLDWMMPVMDGEEFLQLRERELDVQSIPVYVLSAVKCRYGVDPRVNGWIEKPVDLDALLAIVQQHCRPQPHED